jgi:Xaa-Pro aminopeptidase
VSDEDINPPETARGPKVESHDQPVPEKYAAFMRTGWGDRELDLPAHPVVPYAAARRTRLAELFPDERLVIPSGTFKVRANDTDYRFRPDTAHTHLTGNQTSDAVLVIEGGESVLYARPRSSRDTDEFFRDRTYGELWVGRRPSLGEISASLGIATRHIDELPDALGGSAQGSSVKARVLRGVDSRVDRELPRDEARDADFARVLSELRLVKDDWELAELQQACDITTLGFEDSIAEWDRVLEFGERWIEGTFFRRARAMGNDIGYDSIVGGGRHATTLHWIDNTGPIVPGELMLLDMGAEASSLYTADVTRTLPINGTFTGLQRELYSVVLEAQQTGIDAVRPVAHFRDPHHAAMKVIASALGELGLLPCSVDEALSDDNKVYTRWTLHSTSHMLGLDVHDCAAASKEAYTEGELAEGMVLTVEPGL